MCIKCDNRRNRPGLQGQRRIGIPNAVTASNRVDGVLHFPREHLTAYEDRYTDAASSEVRSSPRAPHTDVDFVLDGQQGRVIAQLPADGDDGFRYPVDDSLGALEDVIAEEPGIDPYLGDTTKHLMAPAIPVESHGGGGGRKKREQMKAVISPQRSAIDGRLERGRKLKGDEPRERFHTSIDPETRRILREMHMPVSDVIDEIAALPEVRACK